MYDDLLYYLGSRPGVYEPGEAKFWDDEHISKGMLEAHLDANLDSATRNLGFVRRSADWIAGVSDAGKRPRLLDLGCGPGIYAELFAQRGFDVTGVDLSPRSLAHAKQSAAKKGLGISYRQLNYIDLDYSGEFDIATLIYCDFGVLSPGDRKTLLGNVRRALAPGGLFIVDVCSPAQYSDWEEDKSWSFSGGGFWSGKPHACLCSFYRYDDCRTYCQQYIVIEQDALRRYNIWNHAFTPGELADDLKDAGFGSVRLYGDAAGADPGEELETICAVARLN
jgi:SAM-dependent methyltransferase